MVCLILLEGQREVLEGAAHHTAPLEKEGKVVVGGEGGGEVLVFVGGGGTVGQARGGGGGSGEYQYSRGIQGNSSTAEEYRGIPVQQRNTGEFQYSR